MEFSTVGKFLVLIGVFLVIVGGLIWLLGGLPLGLGRLPGDIHIRGERWSVHIPLATCIVLSILLTLVMNIAIRLLR